MKPIQRFRQMLKFKRHVEREYARALRWAWSNSTTRGDQTERVRAVVRMYRKARV